LVRPSGRCRRSPSGPRPVAVRHHQIPSGVGPPTGVAACIMRSIAARSSASSVKSSAQCFPRGVHNYASRRWPPERRDLREPRPLRADPRSLRAYRRTAAMRRPHPDSGGTPRRCKQHSSIAFRRERGAFIESTPEQAMSDGPYARTPISFAAAYGGTSTSISRRNRWYGGWIVSTGRTAANSRNSATRSWTRRRAGSTSSWSIPAVSACGVLGSGQCTWWRSM
jgi:hypothetical protein